MKENKVKSRRKLTVLLTGAVACVLCFSAGLAVPMLWQSSSANSSLTKLSQIMNILENNWYYSNKIENLDEQLSEQAIAGMTTLSEDLHTNYFSLEQAQQFSSVLAGSNIGIGITFYLDDEGNMVVKSVICGSPAEQAGLLVGDVITNVAGLEAADGTDAIVEKIKDSEGESLEAVYIRDGQEYTASLVPGSYDTSVGIDLQPEYALITINSFSEGTADTFALALQKAKAAGYDSVIIDLRDNSGGYLSAAQGVGASLMPAGSVLMQEEDKDGNRTDILVSSDYDQTELDQIVILQNENTASASEVLIGALKDNLGDEIVTTIGVTSYGKGTEQVSVPFTDGTSLKYTVAKWYTPDGTSIDLTGFDPDIEVEDELIYTTSYAAMAEDETIEADTVAANAAAVQIYLAYLGYPADRTDTYFSEQSSYALSLFQSDQGLEATGIIDADTLETLVNAVSTQLSAQGIEMDAVMLKAVEIVNTQDYNE